MSLRVLAVVLMVFTLAVLAAPAGHARVASTAVASAYSPESSGATNGCDGSRLHDGDLTFASLIVPCGAHVRFCVGHRCVIGVRRDSGPYAGSPRRLFDLNWGLVRRLGFATPVLFGVRRVSWARVA